MKMPAHNPLAPAEFADRMARFGPFETAPQIAVACSGGPDSMALALLADAWARACGGRATALVVDHGMRPDSVREADMVGKWLSDAGIEVVQLKWQGPKPASDRQAAARRARYALLQRWCRNAGVLHLLLAHHRQDQAETFLLRLARGSGVEGLAAMASVRESADVRLLRPLLDIPRARLIANLQSAGQPFVTDPSNADHSFARVRMRAMLPAFGKEGLTESRLAATARRMARARAAIDAAATAVLAQAVAVYPEAYATLTPAPLQKVPEEVGLRALSRLLACIAGNDYGPRLERLERLYRWLTAAQPEGGGRTLAGCRILRRGGTFLVCREAAAVLDPVATQNGVVWDGRFRIGIDGEAADVSRVACLGRAGWERVIRRRPELRKVGLPAAVRTTLPAVWTLDEVTAVPHLTHRQDMEIPGARQVGRITFHPARPLSAPAFDSSASFP